MGNQIIFAVTLASLGLGLVGSLAAQEVPRTLRCTEDPMTYAWWNADGSLETDSDRIGGSVVFDNINVEAGTARVIGEIGSGDVEVRYSPLGAIHFVEQTPIGGLAISTVYLAQRRSDGTYPFALSRHVVTLSREANIMRAFGSCVALV